MPFYHVVFANNRIVSCEEEHRIIPDKGMYYEHNNGMLLFAYLKAVSFADAVTKANELMAMVASNTVEDIV